MEQPTRSDLRAVAALMWLMGRIEQKERDGAGSGGRPYRFTAWLALRLLVESIPPDPRLQTIDQATMFGEPQLLEQGPLVDAVEAWAGDDANAFLTEIAQIAGEEARRRFETHPRRLAEFDRHLRASGEADRLRSS